MSKIISASIDLSKIDKTRIVEGKNGAKYYDLTIFVNDEKNKYDQDVSIATGQTKEERTAKEKRTYIGNGKVTFTKEPETKQEQQASSTNHNNSNDDLPF